MPRSAFIERLKAENRQQAVRKMPPRRTSEYEAFEPGMSVIRYFRSGGPLFQVTVRVYRNSVVRTLRRLRQGVAGHRYERVALPDTASPEGHPEIVLEKTGREAIEDAKRFLEGKPVKRAKPIRRPSRKPAQTPANGAQAQSTPEKAKPKSPAKPKDDAKASPTEEAKARSTEKGTLVWAGVRERTIGERTFKQYSVTVKRFKKGAYVQLWGARLQSALTEAGARKGDWVEVRYLGNRPLENDSNKYEKLYEVRVLDKPDK